MSEAGRPIHPSLPIFLVEQGGESFVYAPGLAYRVEQVAVVELERTLTLNGANPPASIRLLAGLLTARAHQALETWRKLVDTPYEPVCLTIYMSHQCNLRCTYCFAAGERRTSGHEVVSPELAARAAEQVADNCLRAGLPLTVGFHGGGEPTLHWAALQEAVRLTRRIAGQRGIAWRGYIATHGVLSEDKVRWLASEFDHIGLSCDGPADVQDVQRPRSGMAPTSAAVARTAALLASLGTRFDVRATITPASMRRQGHVAAYLAGTLGARSIRFEPAYSIADDIGSRFDPSDAPAFADAFLAAKRTASRYGAELRLSGARPDEIHGPYCNALRQALQLGPDGCASGCFAVARTDSAKRQRLEMGNLRAQPSTRIGETDQAMQMRMRAASIPDRCRRCVNMLHCARNCPERCAVREDLCGSNPDTEFRCRLLERVTRAWIGSSARDDRDLPLPPRDPR